MGYLHVQEQAADWSYQEAGFLQVYGVRRYCFIQCWSDPSCVHGKSHGWASEKPKYKETASCRNSGASTAVPAGASIMGCEVWVQKTTATSETHPEGGGVSEGMGGKPSISFLVSITMQ